MAKKEKFDLDASSLFGNMSQADIREAATKRPGRPKKDDLVRDNSAQMGLSRDLTRQTLIIPVDQVETLKDYAYTERRKLKDVVKEAFDEYIEKHIDKDKLLHRPEDWR